MNQAATVHSLQQRIAEMQTLRLGDGGVPVAPQLSGLLPGGALRKGAATSVQGSLRLALSLLVSASASGAWCGAVGLPELGIEAAAELGLCLDRFVLVPDPGAQTLGITGILSEVLTVVLVHSSVMAQPSEAARLSARLLESGTALVVLGDWPRTDTALRVLDSRWSGLGRGHGMLDTHELTVQSIDRRGPKQHTVRFSGGRLASPAATRGSRVVAI